MIKRIKIYKSLLSVALVLSVFGACKAIKVLNDENYNKCNGLVTQVNDTEQKSLVQNGGNARTMDIIYGFGSKID